MRHRDDLQSFFPEAACMRNVPANFLPARSSFFARFDFGQFSTALACEFRKFITARDRRCANGICAHSMDNHTHTPALEFAFSVYNTLHRSRAAERKKSARQRAHLFQKPSWQSILLVLCVSLPRIRNSTSR